MKTLFVLGVCPYLKKRKSRLLLINLRNAFAILLCVMPITLVAIDWHASLSIQEKVIVLYRI